MARNYRADRKGIVAMLRSAEVRDELAGYAQKAVASVPAYTAHSGETVRAEHRPILHPERGAELIALVHPSSDAIEAKHGLLARAVAATGLQVKGGR